MNFKLTAWAAIISAINLLPSFIIGFMIGFNQSINKPLDETLYFMYIFTLIIGFITSILIVLGYFILSKKIKNNNLKNISILLIIFNIIGLIHSLLFFDDRIKLVSIFILIISGILSIILGIVLLGLKEKFDNLILSLGILYMITGALVSSIIFAVLMPFTALAASILETILFFKLSKKYDKKR